MGRDPPAQCSAGPVGDDCELFHSYCSITSNYYYITEFTIISHFCFFFAVFHWQATIMGPVSGCPYLHEQAHGHIVFKLIQQNSL